MCTLLLPPPPPPPQWKKIKQIRVLVRNEKLKSCYPNKWVWINFIPYNIPHSQGDVDSKGEEGIFLHEFLASLN